MIESVIRFSARNAISVLVATLVCAAAGVLSLPYLAIDAIPDLTDTQIIVTTEYPGQSAQLVEDQITYPLASDLLSVPGAKMVRANSVLGTSFIYVLFNERTDLYWARNRVAERIAAAARKLPPNVTPVLGPEATGVGWIYQYVLAAPRHDLAQLRSLQDWSVRNELLTADGVAEIASIGGFVKTYSVIVEPGRLSALGVTFAQVREALRSGNLSVGGRSIDLAETEYAVTGKGYFRNKDDIENTVVKAAGGAPVLIRDVGRVAIAGDERRGLAELDGEGEVVSGIAIQRIGGNALSTIANVKQAVARLSKSLPEGASLQAIYDRSGLIERAIATLQSTIVKEVAAVALVGIVFLGALRSALIPAVLLPVAVALTLGLMSAFGIGANIMSLGGIAVAIGAMVDAALVMVENARKRSAERVSKKPGHEAIVAASVEVGPALFHSLLIITVSFLPIIGLEAVEGRLFRPLALTKSLAMGVAAVLSVTFIPALMVLLLPRERIERAPLRINVSLESLYRPALAMALAKRRLVLSGALVAVLLSLWPALNTGTEFMPALNEGAILYMPTAQPGLSITKATELLQIQDRILKSFPEVDHVLGKVGRSTTATDPAPIEMFETTITLKPETEWRRGITYDTLVAEMDRALQFPGIANAWTMPIRGRIEMLSTGLRTSLGVKVFGKDLQELDKIAHSLVDVIRAVPGTTSAYAERVMGGHSLEIVPDRRQLARYGLTIADITGIVANGIGAEPVTTMIEGRERYPVIVRFPQAVRDQPQTIGSNVRVSLPGSAATIPLAEVATVAISESASSIRSENGVPVAYIYVDAHEKDVGGYVARAQEAISSQVHLPAGYSMIWSGQYEHLQRATARLKLLVPVALGLILLLLFHLFRRWSETLMVLLSLPFALTGGLWLQYALGYNFSVASAVGFVALAGVAAETGVVMLLYLDQARKKLEFERRSEGAPFTKQDLEVAIRVGALERLRPKVMTIIAIVIGLLPILWSTGAGSEYMQRIAVPMIGGMVSSAFLTLFVIPALYSTVLSRTCNER